MKIIVTGGAGFIGSAVIRYLLSNTNDSVVNVDKLTYAGNLESLEGFSSSDRYDFERVDICDERALEGVFRRYRPDAILNLAAESHVDRSIDGPAEFIRTNIFGTYTLLEVARRYHGELEDEKQRRFCVHHVSTDEVYGDLGESDPLFDESTAYAPSSPYSSSKAASDHMVRAWQRTYGLPTKITNCSNNYGPYQFPEKLIPLMILNALEGAPLPVYGDGQNIRDWLYVDDHARALYLVLRQGRVGETYNIGGHNEIRNIQVVETICDVLAELAPPATKADRPYRELITFVADRPGHDCRYAVDASKIQQDLGWVPVESFETGIRKTVEWYLKNTSWSSRVLDGSYRRERLGTL